MIIFGIIWLLCGIISYGVNFAYFNGYFYNIRKDEYWNNLIFSLIWGIAGGAISLTILIIAQLFGKPVFKYGVKFW